MADTVTTAESEIIVPMYTDETAKENGRKLDMLVSHLDNIATSQRSIAGTSNSAAQAATSASNAKQSEMNSQNSAAQAATSASNAKRSESNAASSASSAAISATNAKQSEDNAASSASSAAISATNAKQSEDNALISATDAQDILEQIKSYSPEFADSVFGTLLDGTNTTKIFRAWWSVSNVPEQTKYNRLCRFADIAAEAWSSKTYTLQSYKAEVSGESAMIPMDDLAGKQPAQLCTDTTDPVLDWADEDPMTWYVRANALSLADGTMNVLYIEGEDGFDITGETAPVYTFALSLWIKEWSDDSYDYISFRTTSAEGFYTDEADIAPDGMRRPITWHSTFPGGLNSIGALTSGAGLKPSNFLHAVNGLTAARKFDPYEGLWNDCDTRWVFRMWQLRHFNLENSNICEGCISYNYQYQVSVAEVGVKRVLLTEMQAANFIPGSTVSIGDSAGETNHDRNRAYMRSIADSVKIADITDVTVQGISYKALNLVMDDVINVPATAWVSTWPWFSGTTEQLPGHKDGSVLSLTDGKTPMRIAGVELLDGALTVGLDPLYQVSAGADESHWTYHIYSCRDSEKLSGNITDDHENTGIAVGGIEVGKWMYAKRFVRTKLGVLFPDLFGGSSSTYYKSAFFGSSAAGVRCPWRFGDLFFGANGGLACGHGDASPWRSLWNGRPRLSGAGKKRG